MEAVVFQKLYRDFNVRPAVFVTGGEKGVQ
jgi:hypothetical protein